MNQSEKARERLAAAPYQEQLLKIKNMLEETSLLMKQDKVLKDAVTHYRVKKCLDRLRDTEKMLLSSLGALTGAPITSGAKHKLIMLGQGDLL